MEHRAAHWSALKWGLQLEIRLHHIYNKRPETLRRLTLRIRLRRHLRHRRPRQTRFQIRLTLPRIRHHLPAHGQVQEISIREIRHEVLQRLRQQLRQLCGIVRRAGIQAGGLGANGEDVGEGRVDGGVEAVFGEEVGEEGGGGEAGEAGGAVGAKNLGHLGDGGLGFEGVEGCFPGQEV